MSVFEIYDQNHQILKDFSYQATIPFLYVVDTIIKETLRKLIEFLKKKNEEEYRDTKQEKKDSFDNGNVNISIQEKKSNNGHKTDDPLENYKNMLNIIEETSQKNEYRFVLKLEGYEEYLFGDYSISSYECIRKYVRQISKVHLVLFKKPIFLTEPPISNYPPIIYMEQNSKFNYFDLLDKYFAQYPHECAVFRFGETGSKEKEQFLVTKKTRQEKLLQFTESGECDYPFQITICGVYNLSSIFKWLNNEEYSKNELMLFYFNDDFETKEEFEENLIRNKISKFFGCKKKESVSFRQEGGIMRGNTFSSFKPTQDSEKVKKDKEKEKEKQKEKKEKDKAVSLIRKSYKENAKMQRYLNILKINKKEDVEKNDIIKKKFSIYTTFTNEMFSKANELENKPFYEETKRTDKHLKYSPMFVKVNFELLYGSYQVEKCSTKHYIISDNINMMETITFNNDKLIISHLPRETRVGITVVLLNKETSSPIEVGSCQIPLFQEDGLFTSGEIKISLWPLFKIEPRINCCDPFLKQLDMDSREQSSHNSGESNENLKNHKQSEISKPKDGRKISGVPLSLLPNNTRRGTTFHHKKEDSKKSLTENKNASPPSVGMSSPQQTAGDDSDDEQFEKFPKYEEKKCKESNYCYLILQFPKFAKELAHVPKTPSSYKNFLKLKYKDSSNTQHKDDYNPDQDSFKELYGSMISEMDSILEEMKETSEKSENPSSSPHIDDDEKASLSSPNSLKFPMIEKYLNKIGNVIRRDALREITPEERKQVLICRDYISTIPNSIDVFLRSINWFNPLHVYIAHLYIKRWAKLEAEDAIGLLDSRFPDTQVRELAIKTLSGVTDDIIELYIMELCQCLFYESYLLSPLADFLIEKSLSNQILLGNKFYWCAKVGSENIQFKDRLSIIMAQMFMMSGPKFIDDIERKIKHNEEFKAVSKTAKENYPIMNNEQVKSTVVDIIEQWIKDGNFNFDLPIHPSYFAAGYDTKKIKVFDSKMVPIRVALKSSDGGLLSVIFKIGDDLRQDVLILQMFKIMDKMWLENDLDLKISIYNVCPIELKCGFVEFVNASVLEGVQKEEGLLGGALDRELLYNYLKKISLKNEKDSDKLLFENQLDNFIRSLAGYCVATGVLGIGDRHSANVMIKENGLFFHIDFGHIFGNFKKKCGFKRERSRFLLTHDMAYVYIKSNNEEKFKNYCVKAYNILRHNGQRLLNLIITMSSAGMPEFSTMADVKYFQNMLQLDKKNDEDAGNYFITLIKESVNEKYRILDNLIHNCIHI